MISLHQQLKEKFEHTYALAESVVKGEAKFPHKDKEHIQAAMKLANVKHAFRGAAVTLLGYKLIKQDQDIRAHKDEYKDGFSARTFDTKVTVPFLIEKSLPRSVESHWLTQTLSFAGVLTEGETLKTQPKIAGPLLIEVVNYAQKLSIVEIENMLLAIFISLIKIRNADKVILTRPKHQPIDVVKYLLHTHFSTKYKSNAPRLPQLAMYAIYQSIIGKMSRFDNQTLEEIKRMKSADRKSGTVGDVVVLNSAGLPEEAVEIKFGQPISSVHVSEAIEKVRGASVSRYYMLSTAGILEADIELISEIKLAFLKQNGCEIIVNGVIDTIGYYLRLLPNTTEFLSNYASLLEQDPDTSYEHRVAWNDICAKI